MGWDYLKADQQANACMFLPLNTVTRKKITKCNTMNTCVFVETLAQFQYKSYYIRYAFHNDFQKVQDTSTQKEESAHIV